jgi:hypothetical protein
MSVVRPVASGKANKNAVRYAEPRQVYAPALKVATPSTHDREADNKYPPAAGGSAASNPVTYLNVELLKSLPTHGYMRSRQSKSPRSYR